MVVSRGNVEARGLLLSFNRYENYQDVAGSQNLRTRTCHFLTRGTLQERERRYQKMLLLFFSSVRQCLLPAWHDCHQIQKSPEKKTEEPRKRDIPNNLKVDTNTHKAFELLYSNKDPTECIRTNTAFLMVFGSQIILITLQINHQPDAKIFQCIILTFIYSSTCFRRSPTHNQELNGCSSSLWFYLRIVVTAVVGPVNRPDHGYHHDMKVKPEAASAVVELLIVGGRTPETCWAVNKRQDNKLEKL